MTVHLAWHGILFEEPNPEREPPTRPNWALEDDDTDDTGNLTPPNTQGRAGGTRKTQPAERSNWGGGKGQQGLSHGILLEEPNPCLFKRETEHLYPRQPIHGIGRDPFARE